MPAKDFAAPYRTTDDESHFGLTWNAVKATDNLGETHRMRRI